MSRKLFLSLLVLLLSVSLAEVFFRYQPLQRVQRVQKFDNHTLRMLNGVPVWETKDPARAGVYNRDCLDTAESESTVYLAGDSIFYGVSVEPIKTLAPVLENMLSTSLGRPICVVNLAEPGFGFRNEKAVLEEAIAQHKPKVVVLQMWFNSVSQFVLVDGDAYNFGNMVTDSLGLPNLGVPPSLNQRFFTGSAIWRHVSMGFAPTQKGGTKAVWKKFTDGELEAFRVWLAERDIELMLAYATTLKAPFSEGRIAEDNVYAAPKQWAAEHGLPQVFFSEVLGEEDTETVGVDKCCHLNEYGIKLVADAIGPKLSQLLETEPK